MIIPDFNSQFQSAMRSGMQLGGGMRSAMRQDQLDQERKQQQALERRKLERLEALDQDKEKQKEIFQTVGFLAAMDPADRDSVFPQVAQKFKDNPMAIDVISKIAAMEPKQQDRALFGLMSTLKGQIAQTTETDKKIKSQWGIDTSFDKLPASMKEYFMYSQMSPEEQQTYNALQNIRDETPEQRAAIKQAEERVKRQYESLNTRDRYLLANVKAGQDAKSILDKTDKAMKILENLETGGVAAARNDMANFFGIQTKDSDDMATLQAIFGGLVLDQLSTLGANPTEGEREYIEKMTGSLKNNPRANMSLMRYIQDQARKQYERGRNGYTTLAQSNPEFASTTFDQIYQVGQFAPQQQQPAAGGQMPQQQPPAAGGMPQLNPNLPGGQMPGGMPGQMPGQMPNPMAPQAPQAPTGPVNSLQEALQRYGGAF